MKKLLPLLTLLFASVTFANVKIDISYKLMSVTENTVINGLDENTEEGVIFITESLHLENGVRIKIRNACLIILGDISGNGILDVDETATVTLEGEKKGRVTFIDRFLADSTCQQDTGNKTFKHVREIPTGVKYSLYTLSGRLLDSGIIDEYIHNYVDPKTYLIKVEGYKLRKIVFKN
ncbi:hypothetical protein D1818_23190 [Aquimarina sp. BL5]|uniref:hypothetical protein n=1 Tax=Aquimarina sp. BL5 TaxID=1714860 RepID=UPI000E533A22|nr:hypothetical protein [Aquimarina sp. BL5]AXT53588.1 hypothetical protein D1818_23190 [Aquimarina sp. BL5]RKN02104.1 hypothetical protein D7036_16835 [Aquimarina sp. BL5]